MTKWKRLRRRKKRIMVENALDSNGEQKEAKLTEPENISENIRHSQETEKLESVKNFKPNIILAQIPRYAYLLAIFVLLAGVFFPLITPGMSFDIVIQGTATLFLGLVGGILLFKATTSNNRRSIFIAIGFALIAICLTSIYHVKDQSYF